MSPLRLLRARRAYIRSRIFNSRRGHWGLSSSGLDAEAAKGGLLAFPMILSAMAGVSLPVIAVLSVPAVFGMGYAIFVLTVGFKAIGERGDMLYDKRTKHLLPPEYRETESQTAAKRRTLKRQAENEGDDRSV